MNRNRYIAGVLLLVVVLVAAFFLPWVVVQVSEEPVRLEVSGVRGVDLPPGSLAGPIRGDGWNTGVSAGGATVPNWMILVYVAAMAASSLLFSKKWPYFLFGALGVAHLLVRLIAWINSLGMSPQIGVFAALAVFVALAVIMPKALAPSEPEMVQDLE